MRHTRLPRSATSTKPAQAEIVDQETGEIVQPESHEQYALSLMADQGGPPIFRGITYEDHVEAWQALDASGDRHLWAKAAVAASLVRQVSRHHGLKGTDIQRFAHDVRCSRQWVEVCSKTHAVFTCKDVFACTNLAGIRFWHCVVAATLTDTTAEAVAAIEEAHDKEWSVRDLASELRRRRVRLLTAAELPTGKYRVLYADPPWFYGTPQHGKEEQKTVLSSHYESMKTEAICALPVNNLAASNAVLFLWATSPLLFESKAVIEAWGFTYRASIIWDKVKHNVGYYVSVRHEFLLICTRGSCLPDSDQLLDSVVTLERTEHSRKPEHFRKMIDTLYQPPADGVVDRIELFKRGALPAHWHGWGNQ